MNINRCFTYKQVTLAESTYTRGMASQFVDEGEGLISFCKIIFFYILLYGATVSLDP